MVKLGKTLVIHQIRHGFPPPKVHAIKGLYSFIRLSKLSYSLGCNNLILIPLGKLNHYYHDYH